MNKVLITGSNGLLGQATVGIFSHDFEVIGCDLSRDAHEGDNVPGHYIRLDLTDRTEVKRAFTEIRPDIIINTAAYTDVDGCENNNEACWSGNVRTVENMLDACTTFSPVFIHISTDYVFDGTSPPYRESDPPKPLGYYGLTKLAAEKAVRSSHVEYIIARTMILFGTGKQIRLNFATWVIDQLTRKNRIRVVNDQVGNPTYAEDLAEAILRLLKKEEYGLFHIAGSEVCSRFEFACLVAEVFGLDAGLIDEITTSDLGQKALRPMNSSFSLDKLENTIDWIPAKLADSLKKLKSRMRV